MAVLEIQYDTCTVAVVSQVIERSGKTSEGVGVGCQNEVPVCTRSARDMPGAEEQRVRDHGCLSSIGVSLLIATGFLREFQVLKADDYYSSADRRAG